MDNMKPRVYNELLANIEYTKQTEEINPNHYVKVSDEIKKEIK